MATHRSSRYARTSTLHEESPEIQALSPPIQTQELPPTAAAPRPRARRRGQNVEEQLQSQSVGPAVVTAQEQSARQQQQTQQQQQPATTPARRQPINGVSGSIPSSVKPSSSVLSVNSKKESYPTEAASSSKQKLETPKVQPESSPLKEPLPPRARIRHSLLPQDHSGRLTVRAEEMENRVRMILTVAQDAILTSMRYELDEMGEVKDTWDYLMRVWDALDCKRHP